MKTKKTDPTDVMQSMQNTPDFSLVMGGPFYRLLHWTHLSDDALMHVRLRVIVLSLIVWLPLLILSGLEGHLFTGSPVSFLMDLEAHTRYLLV